MDTVILKHGNIEAHAGMVKVTMLSLHTLFDSLQGVTAFYDLVMKARDRNYKISYGDNEGYLKKVGLLQEDGSIHEAVKEIVLSAAVGDGLEMKLVSPIVT